MNWKAFTIGFIVSVIVTFAAMATFASAADKKLTVAWDYDAAKVSADKIVGFRIKDGAGNAIIDNIAPTDRTVSKVVNVLEGCQSYYMTAYTADRETGPSRVLTWCPPVTILTNVGQFTLEITNP